MAIKFLQNVTQDVELNRVQANVAEALRQLENSLTLAYQAAISALPGSSSGLFPPVGTITPGSVWMYSWSGTNTANALRQFNANLAGSSINANAGEIRFQVPYDGTFQTMLISMSAAYPNGGLANVTRFTLRKNGVGSNAAQDTALEVTLGPGDVGGTLFSNLIDSVHFVAGDWAGVTYNEVSMNGAMVATVFANLLFVAD